MQSKFKRSATIVLILSEGTSKSTQNKRERKRKSSRTVENAVARIIDAPKSNQIKRKKNNNSKVKDGTKKKKKEMIRTLNYNGNSDCQKRSRTTKTETETAKESTNGNYERVERTVRTRARAGKKWRSRGNMLLAGEVHVVGAGS